jgi:hypothetical protein
MGHSSDQRITTLLVPVFLLAALAGTLVGGAVGGLMTVLPYLADRNLWGLEPWGVLVSVTATWVFIGAMAGFVYGLVAGAGAITGLAIQSAKCQPVTAREQALASALGAAAGSAVLAAAAVAIDTEAAAGSFGVAAAFVLATFLVALLVGRIYLRRREARDQATPPTTRDEHSDLRDKRYGKH